MPGKVELGLLDRCIIFATQKHAGQLDKVGLPYILHPLRVMLDPSLKTEEQQCVAVLHDVLEDTNTSYQELLFLTKNPDIVNSVIYLTHVKNAPNIEYWKQILEDPSGNARIVKLADIRDNTSEFRMTGLLKEDQMRLTIKYSQALQILNADQKA